MKWTPEQLEAITKNGCNLIVSAGAGSGKTAVLSTRVLKLIESGVDIRSILILTFTNEAAGEMKNRIRQKLKEANLKEALEYLDSAYITTFDAFALSIVRKYHYLLNISPNLKIVEKSLIDLQKIKVIDNLFTNLYENKDSKFLKMVQDFTLRSDNELKEAVFSMSSALDLRYDKTTYLQNYLDNYYTEEYYNQVYREYFNYLKDLCTTLESKLYEISNYVSSEVYTKLYESYSVVFSPRNLEDIAKINNRSKAKFYNVEEDGKHLIEEIKEIVKTLEEATIFNETELKEQYFMTKDYVSVLISIILKLDTEIKTYKDTHEVYEFNDISKMAIQIVKENPEVLKELQEQFTQIMIDEYQDTSDLQEEFIQLIANNNVYMVGDIKQSIYRFRNANPHIFREKYQKYAQENGGSKIDLVQNFRSREEVLANINQIFTKIMINDVGGINYQDNQAMVYGNLSYTNYGTTQDNHNIQIFTYEENPQYNNYEIEAFKIAQDIQEKIYNKYQVFDFKTNSLRDINYADFCIILDRSKDMASYKKIFEYLNIPLEVYQDSNLNTSNDLLIFKNILNLILKIKNQEYDNYTKYYFTSIERSYLGNLSDEEIFLTLENKTINTTSTYQHCLNLLDNLENKTIRMLIEEIIQEFNIYENILKVGDINNSFIRLSYILDLASSSEELGLTIPDFVHLLEEIIAENQDLRYREVKGVGSCVKLMNIHKSKGLEFPICYYAGLKARFNLADIKRQFLYSPKYGIITPFYHEGIGQTFMRTLLKKDYLKEEIAEKLRLFYVALTRAKEQIILVCPEFKGNYNLVNKDIIMHYRSFYDFLASIYADLKNYISYINVDNLDITSKYINLAPPKVTTSALTQDSINFHALNISFNLLKKEHASKTVKHLLTKEEQSLLNLGTSLHELLEYSDFQKPSSNKYVKKLQSTFDFSHATIYQELEFSYIEKSQEIQGVIDLMLEYPDNIKIIDYKLKNIEDKEYINQLNTYYNYIKTTTNKPIELYLYSLIDEKIREVEVLTNN